MSRALAEELQALLAARGLMLPITEKAPGIVITAYTGGDPYGGETYSETITVDQPPLYIQFCFAEHQLSGQCDAWTLEVRGARDEDRAAFGEVFHPRQRDGYWNNHVGPVYRFNGAQVAFEP